MTNGIADHTVTIVVVIMLLIFSTGATWFVLSRLRAGGGAWWRFRGKRVVICPENREHAAVTVDAKHAAAAAIRGSFDLRLQDCSRWPERRSCGQECLAQIEAAPEGCLLSRMLTQWYIGKQCVLCGKPFEAINWLDRRPALMNPEHRTVEWSEIPPEKIPAALETHKPVCFRCHVAETFRRQFPELVADRDWKRGQ